MAAFSASGAVRAPPRIVRPSFSGPSQQVMNPVSFSLALYLCIFLSPSVSFCVTLGFLLFPSSQCPEAIYASPYFVFVSIPSPYFLSFSYRLCWKSADVVILLPSLGMRFELLDFPSVEEEMRVVTSDIVRNQLISIVLSMLRMDPQLFYVSRNL